MERMRIIRDGVVREEMVMREGGGEGGDGDERGREGWYNVEERMG